MANEEIHIEDAEELKAFFKHENQKLIDYYHKHIDNSEKRLKKIREVAFKYDLPVEEYEKKCRVIDQYLEICRAILQEEIGNYADFKGEFDNVLWTFNERAKQIKNEKKSLKGCKKIILGTIDKLRKQEEENKKRLGNNANIFERKGFDLGFSDKQLASLHKALIDNKFLDSQTDLRHFISAFNGEVLKGDFKPMEWIEKAKNHHISIRGIFQLLISCNIDLKGEHNISPEIREKIKLIFTNDFGNIQSKFNDFENLKAPTQSLTLIKTTILTLNLNKV